MTLGEVLESTAGYLARKGIDTPRLDAELILAHAFGLSRLELYTSFDRPLTEAERDRARPLVERRGRREPLAYVLGEWGFRRLTLKTDARALVPRPETEVVVERALAAIEQFRRAAGRRRWHRHGRDRARDRRRASRRRRHGHRCFARRRSSSPARTPRGSAWRSASSRRACSTASTGRSTWSSRTHRTWAPKRSAALQPEVRDWEPRIAVVGDRQTELLAEAARDETRTRRSDRAREPRGPCGGGRRPPRRSGLPGGDGLSRSRRKREGGRGPMDVIEALAAGLPVLLPADGVYGLCSAPGEEPVRRLYELKGRGPEQPTAIIAASVETLLELIPELRGRPEAIVRAILPGPYTLVLPNPARRYPWLNGERPDTIGVRVARVPARDPARPRRRRARRRHERERAGRAVGREPRRRPAAHQGRLRRRARRRSPSRAEPSTVVDVTGDEPRRPPRGCRRGRRGAGCGATTMTPTTSTKEPHVAIAQETFEHLRTAGLADVDPEIADTLGASSSGSGARSS